MMCGALRCVANRSKLGLGAVDMAIVLLVVDELAQFADSGKM